MNDDRSLMQTLIAAAVSLLALYVVAVPFYMNFEGLSLIDAVYFVTVSITSAGYGDITPKTDTGKIFSVFLLLAGVSIFFYHVLHFGKFKEKAIDPHIRRRIEVLKNLTFLHSGNVEKSDIKRIREKMNYRFNDDKIQGFGRL